MITKTYVVKMAAEGDAIQHRDFVSAEIEKITFVRPVNVLCIDRDVPDSRFMREDLYSQEELDKAYARGLRQGKKEGWSLARTLILTPEDGGIGHAEIIAAFGEAASGYMILRDLGVFGAEQMYKEWRTAPLEVGDIVILKDANPVRGVVTSVEKDSEFCYGILFEDGMHGSFCLDDLEKTGEHINMTDIFKKLKGEGIMLDHPIDLEKMTAEQAIQGTIDMWTDMMAKLGENPFTHDRVVFKKNWLWEHGYTEKGPFATNLINGNCFLCEYGDNKTASVSKCDRCPIRWPDNTLDFHFCKGSALDYRKAPIPDILEYLKNKENWREE